MTKCPKCGAAINEKNRPASGTVLYLCGSWRNASGTMSEQSSTCKISELEEQIRQLQAACKATIRAAITGDGGPRYGSVAEMLADDARKQINELKAANAALIVRVTSANKMAYEVANVVLDGAIRTRTKLTDALEAFLNIGSGGAMSVPEWMSRYAAAEATERGSNNV